MQKRIISIRFSDYYFQSGFIIGNQHQITIKEEPIYVKYLAKNVLYFQNAFKSIKSICLMQSKQQLQNKLNEEGKKLTYQLPTAEQLWCDIMKRIIDFSIEKTEKNNTNSIKVGGIIVSLPNYLEQSLREMIMISIQYCKNDEIPIKVISNSISSALCYPIISIVDLKFANNQTVDDIHTVCFIENGLYSTEWSIVLSKNQNSIVLKTKINKKRLQISKKIQLF